MRDNFGRSISYLRLSVTDLCNLRCVYCMPDSGVEKLCHASTLTNEEIEDIVRATVACGIEKVRITGGEPLVRPGILDICKRVSDIKGIKEVCLTTNGVLLKQYAKKLKEAGVDRLNISLDTLDPVKFESITRIGTLEDVLEGIEAAKEAGFRNTKINAVLMGGVNDDEIEDFVEMTRFDDVNVRFIELMPIGECADWDSSSFISGEEVLAAVPGLVEEGNSGVARIYRVPGYKGTVGLISPISSHFCPSCNRIRITADGKLKPCLHSMDEINLKGLVGEQLEKTIKSAIVGKPKRHNMTDGKSSESLRSMYEIGG